MNQIEPSPYLQLNNRIVFTPKGKKLFRALKNINTNPKRINPLMDENWIRSQSKKFIDLSYKKSHSLEKERKISITPQIQKKPKLNQECLYYFKTPNKKSKLLYPRSSKLNPKSKLFANNSALHLSKNLNSIEKSDRALLHSFSKISKAEFSLNNDFSNWKEKMKNNKREELTGRNFGEARRKKLRIIEKEKSAKLNKRIKKVLLEKKANQKKSDFERNKNIKKLFKSSEQILTSYSERARKISFFKLKRKRNVEKILEKKLGRISLFDRLRGRKMKIAIQKDIEEEKKLYRPFKLYSRAFSRSGKRNIKIKTITQQAKNLGSATSLTNRDISMNSMFCDKSAVGSASRFMDYCKILDKSN